MSITLTLQQPIVYIGGGYPPKLLQSTVTAFRDCDPVAVGEGEVITLRRVHIAAEPDGADHFSESDIWPDTPEVRAFLETVIADLMDEETYYSEPRFRDPVTKQLPDPTSGQQKWLDVQARCAAFRAGLV